MNILNIVYKMTVKEAMTSYFNKLISLYKREFGTLPTVPYNRECDSTLFVGHPDEDGEIQWEYSPAKTVRIESLCEELNEFYSSFYYWQLRGKIGKYCFYFPPVINEQDAIKTAELAIERGKKVFPNEKYVMIASCDVAGFDGLDLIYDQNTNKLFFYDFDGERVIPCDYSLKFIISQMEVVI